jgi:hypothetical protein
MNVRIVLPLQDRLQRGWRPNFNHDILANP